MPITIATRLNNTDRGSICLKFFASSLADVAGIINRAVTSINPTILIEIIMVMLLKIFIRYSRTVVLMPLIKAASLSKII